MKRNWRGICDENQAPGDRLSSSKARSRSTERSSIPRPTPRISGVAGNARIRPDNLPQKRSASVGRSSVAPGPMRNRQSSLSNQALGQGFRRSSGGLGTNKPLTDVRNLSDKGARQHCARDVHKFLLEHGYGHPIQMRDLVQGPSSTDFWRIFEFLHGFVDEAFTFLPSHDKAQVFLDKIKNIGYPFNISNSHLKTIGSPHSWHYLLGVLHWMIGPIQTTLALDGEQVLLPGGGLQIDASEEEAHIKRLQWGFVSDTYEAFMDGEDEYEGCIKQHEDDIKKLVHGLGGDAHTLAAELEKLTQKKQRIESEPDAFAEAQRSLGVHEEDRAKLYKHVDEKKNYFEKLQQMVGTLKKDNEALEKQTMVLADDKKRLQVIYDAQDLRPEDLQKINLERSQLYQRNKDALQQKEELSKLVGIKQMEIANFKGTTDQLVNEFNSRAREAHLVPETAANAFGNDLSLFANSTNVADIHGRLKQALLRVKKGLQDRGNNVELKIVDLKGTFDEWEDHLKSRQTELRAKEESLEKLETEFEEKKREMAEEIETIKTEQEREKKDIAELRFRLQSINKDDSEINEDFKKEQRKLADQRQRITIEQDTMDKTVKEVCRSALDHKERMMILKRERVAKIKEMADRAEAAVAHHRDWQKNFKEELNRRVCIRKKVSAENTAKINDVLATAEAFLRDHESFVEKFWKQKDAALSELEDSSDKAQIEDENAESSDKI